MSAHAQAYIQDYYLLQKGDRKNEGGLGRGWGGGVRQFCLKLGKLQEPSNITGRISIGTVALSAPR